MASKYLNLSGTTKWVNGKFGGLFEPDPEYGNYQLQFYPNPDSWDKIKKSGLRLQAKNDEDGDFLKFRRPKEKIIKGEKIVFGRPKVFFVESIEPTKNIGNGSSVDVSVVVYDAGQHKGHRLESVTVTDLVVFERSGGSLQELKDDNDTAAPRAEREARTDDSEQARTEEDTAKGEATKKQPSEVPFDDGVPFGDKKEEVKTNSPFKRKMSR